MKAKAAYLGLNRSTGPIGKLVTWVQAPIPTLFGMADQVPTHSRLGFIMEDDSACYFEALEGHGGRGPRPERWVQAWAVTKSDRWTRCFRLPIEPDDCESIHQGCLDHLDLWEYSIPQLVAVYLNLRFRIPVIESKRRVICSEAVARWTAGHFDLRYPGKKHDNTTPLDQWKIARMAHLVEMVYDPVTGAFI